jgi:hypothetical protein
MLRSLTTHCVSVNSFASITIDGLSEEFHRVIAYPIVPHGTWAQPQKGQLLVELNVFRVEFTNRLPYVG